MDQIKLIQSPKSLVVCAFMRPEYRDSVLREGEVEEEDQNSADLSRSPTVTLHLEFLTIKPAEKHNRSSGEQVNVRFEH